MPKNRSLATLAVAALLSLAAATPQDPFGFGPGPGPEAPARAKAEPRPPTEAEAAIDAALERLAAVESFAADVEMTARMLGQEFRVAGPYLKAPGNKILLRLEVHGLGDVRASLQQVSDGQTLWEFSEVLGSRFLSRLALGPVLEAVDRSGAEPKQREQWLTQLGFGGPEALIRGLRRSVKFDGPVEEVEADGRTLQVFRGEWEDRATLGLPGQGLILPAYVPKHVELRLDKADGWPHQLLLRGEVPSAVRIIDNTGRLVSPSLGGGKDRPTEMRLAYTRRDRAPVDADFAFDPPANVQVADNTEALVAGLQAQAAEAAARRRSEAAGQGGDLLDAPLTAPRVTPEPDPGAAPDPGPAPSPESFRSSARPR